MEESYPLLADTPALRKQNREEDWKLLKELFEVDLVAVLRPEDRPKLETCPSLIELQNGDDVETYRLNESLVGTIDEAGAKSEIETALKGTGLIQGPCMPEWISIWQPI